MRTTQYLRFLCQWPTAIAWSTDDSIRYIGSSFKSLAAFKSLIHISKLIIFRRFIGRTLFHISTFLTPGGRLYRIGT